MEELTYNAIIFKCTYFSWVKTANINNLFLLHIPLLGSIDISYLRIFLQNIVKLYDNNMKPFSIDLKRHLF